MTAPAPDPYASAIELQQDLVDWSRRLVDRLLLERPPGARPSPDGLSALAVSHEEAAAFVGRGEEEDDAEARAAAREGVAGGWRRIGARLEASAATGVDLPLERLRGFFGLSDDEVRLVAALFAPEVDEDAGRAYRYAWNDFTRKRVEVGFLIGLLGLDAEFREALRRLLAPSATLLLRRVVVLGPASDDEGEVSFLSRWVRLPNRVVDFLRGEEGRLDETLSGVAAYVEPAQRLADLLVPEIVPDQLRRSLARRRGADVGPLLLVGPPGVGKRSLVEALAGELERALLVADLEAVFADARPPDEVAALLVREATLTGALLYLWGGVALPEELPRLSARRLAASLQAASGPVFLGLATVPHWLERSLPIAPRVSVPLPGPEVREVLWGRFLPAGVRVSKRADLAELARRYGLTGGAVKAGAEAAAARARQRAVKQATVTQDDLEFAARAQVLHRLGTLATRLSPTFDWCDLILPDDEMDRLHEMVAYARNRSQVYDQWGFSAKVPYGRGLSGLFSGPPGTGKTMGAMIVARELGLELFKVDLSRIVDRYIGETEKNLARVFDEATESQAVLLFDEADSLFAKRTAVRSSVDRYANLEVNYLLQRMEEFEGVTILTTNFDAAFDEAFRRRIRFAVTFPFPEAVDRRRLWQSMFPETVRMADGVDWDKLASAFEMSGGHIKNAALRAAFLTAEAGRDVIGESALWDAARLEYLEMGKLVRG